MRVYSTWSQEVQITSHTKRYDRGVSKINEKLQPNCWDKQSCPKGKNIDRLGSKVNLLTSGNMSTFLPAAISNEYTFISADTAYAYKRRTENP